jgi:hypothetical protein
MEEKTKECSKCKKELALSNFHADNSKKDRRKNICIACSRGLRKLREKNMDENIMQEPLDKFKQSVNLLCDFAKDEDIRDPSKLLHDFTLEVNETIEKAFFPPTNKITFPNYGIKGGGDTKQNIAMIRSMVDFYLVSQKQLSGINIIIKMDSSMSFNILHNVILPDDILLTHEEIMEMASMIVENTIPKMFGRVKVVLNDMDIPMTAILKITSDFLFGLGRIFDSKKINFHFDDGKMLIDLPDNCHIPKKSIVELEKKLQEFLIEYA